MEGGVTFATRRQDGRGERINGVLPKDCSSIHGFSQKMQMEENHWLHKMMCGREFHKTHQ